MALAEAEYLKRRYDLIISIPNGPLRKLARHGEVISGTSSMPLWGDSARTWLGRSVRTISQSVRLARTIRRRNVELVPTSSSVSLGRS